VTDPSVEEDIGRQLPQKIFLPDQNGDKAKVKVDPAAHDHLEQEDSPHDDHHFLDDRCQTISKREAVVGHFNFLFSSPFNKGGLRGILTTNSENSLVASSSGKNFKEGIIVL